MITAVIPALNESARIAGVITFAKRHPLVKEVLVIDDGSIDGTPELSAAMGAKVITSSLLGKGTSMAEGLQAATQPVVVYLDGDLTGLREDLLDHLTRPLLEEKADFVKAKFTRSAGRVTTLTAKPLLQLFFPELAKFEQPLGGIVAARAELLRKLHFETDYGVDLALLIDAHMVGARIAEADIGHLEHDSQSLEALGEMAKQVVRVLLHRAERHNRLHGQQIREVEEVERHAQAELAIVAQARKSAAQQRRLALFDMDGTLLQGRFIVELAKRHNRLEELRPYLDNPTMPDAERTERIAEAMRGLPVQAFTEVAGSMPLSRGAVETVVGLRKLGYCVGIVTDSYRVAAEVVRRRVFADFSVANLMRFREGVATGECTPSPLFLAGQYAPGENRHTRGFCLEHDHCKKNALRHLCGHFQVTAEEVLAVGDGRNDVCMLRAAGLGIAFAPKQAEVAAAAQFVVPEALNEVLLLAESRLRQQQWAQHLQRALPA